MEKTEDIQEKLTQEELTIIEGFEEVKNSYYRPPVKGPMIIKKESLESGIGTALFDQINNVVGINLPFVKKLSAHSDKQSAFLSIARGLISHEIGHYMFHPAELSLSLFLSYNTTRLFPDAGGAKQDMIYQLYLDYQDNNLIVNNSMHSDDLKNTLTASFKANPPSLLAIALHKEYRRTMALPEIEQISNMKLEKEDSRKIDSALKGLEKIVVADSQEYGFHTAQLKIFGESILPLLESDEKYGGNSMQGLKNLIYSGAIQRITAEDIENLPEVEKDKIITALEKISKRISKGDYEKIMEYFLKKSPESDVRGKGIGKTPLDNKIAEMSVVEYYKTLARAHNGIVIRPKRISALQLQNIEFGLKEFHPSDNPSRIDLRFSGGMIIPGLTKTRRQRKILSPSELDVVPSLILYKDASGSMPDPSADKCYATLAGTMLVQSYIGSGAEVKIALFDASCDELSQTKREDELLRILCSYKGGGTTFDIEKMRKELEETRKNYYMDEKMLASHPLAKSYMKKQARVTMRAREKKGNLADIVIITDGGISNIKELTSFLNENQNYRPIILHTEGFSLDIPGYDQKTSGTYDGISIYKINSVDDFIKFGKKILYENLLQREKRIMPSRIG
ncbi:MAG: hypothetical protein AABW65_01310 [Nanoarchaeota archaeon]